MIFPDIGLQDFGIKFRWSSGRVSPVLMIRNFFTAFPRAQGFRSPYLPALSTARLVSSIGLQQFCSLFLGIGLGNTTP
jgi:hypothetical protein